MECWFMFFSLAGSSTCLKLWQRPFLPIPTTLYQLLQFIPFEALKTRPDSDQFLQVKKPTAVGLPTRLLTVFPSDAKHCILELGNPPSASLLLPAIQPTSPSDCPDPSTPWPATQFRGLDTGCCKTGPRISQEGDMIRLIFHDVFILKWRGSIKSF